MKRFVTALFILLMCRVGAAQAQTLPPGFQDELVLSGLGLPTAVAFSPDGRVFVAEKSGLIKVFDDLDDPTPDVFADLRTDVHNWWDRGLLGLALDPDFPTSPYVYALYAFDADIGNPAGAPKWGSPGVDSDSCPTNDPSGCCIASNRLVRLEAAGNAAVAEVVLIHDWFLQFNTHAIGSLAFGADGFLYVTGGEGARALGGIDTGQWQCPGEPPGAYPDDPPGEGGALRAQDLRTAGDAVGLSGTVVRIDPDTGAAAPGNPLASDPDPNARRIVAHGLRNPYRMTIRPGTNELWIGDVGWNSFEELNHVPDPLAGVYNFGWPCYEGSNRQFSYDTADVAMCEALYADEQTPAAATPPLFDYFHSSGLLPGDACAPGTGSSITGLAFYGAGGYPAAYTDALFVADYSRNCVWVMFPDASGDPDPGNIANFAVAANTPVQLQVGPGGDVYYVDIAGGAIRRFRFYGDDMPPEACVTADPSTGTPPLAVNFDASCSTDPNPGDTLAFAWDLDGDGEFDDAVGATPSHTFTDPCDVTVAVRVTDAAGNADVATITITPGNAPPVPTIATPSSSFTWSIGEQVAFSGSATDPDDGALTDTALSWELILFHCPTSIEDCHQHPIETLPGVSSGAISAPAHEYPSYIELSLSATDSCGVSTTTTVTLQPEVVIVDMVSDPPGLQLGLDGLGAAAPFSDEVIDNAVVCVSAPTPQTLGGDDYEFVSWSDGGAANHCTTITTATGPLVATYQLVAGSAPLPTVVDAVIPADGETAAPVDTALVLHMNVPVGAAAWTTNIDLHRADDDSLVESIKVLPEHIDGTVVTLPLSAPLAFATDYYVVIYRKALQIMTAPWGYIGDYTTYPGGDALDPTMWNFTTETGAPDVEAPTAPTNLVATPTASDGVDLSWTAATDNTGVAEYRLFRAVSGEALALVTSLAGDATSYADAGLAPATSYDYELVAVDAAGNTSAPAAVSATTGAAPVVAQVTVTPDGASIDRDTTLQLSAALVDQYGDPITAPVVWQVIGVGSVDGTGLYAAGPDAGTATVTATAGGISDSVAITVNEVTSAPLPTVVVSVTPADDAVGVAIDTSLGLSLSVPVAVHPWTSNIALHRADDDSLVESIKLEAVHLVDAQTVSVPLAAPLTAGTSYYVVIYRKALQIETAPWGYIGDYTDYPGGDALDPTMWNFTTAGAALAPLGTRGPLTGPVPGDDPQAPAGCAIDPARGDAPLWVVLVLALVLARRRR